MKQIAFVFLLLSAVACRESGPPPSREVAHPIEVAVVEKADVPRYVYGVGYIHTVQRVEVRPQVTGILVKAHISEGQHVKIGDLLFSIDDNSYRALYDGAVARLTQDEETLRYAEEVVKRYTPLVEREYLSALDYEGYASQVAQLQAQVQASRAVVRKAAIDLGHTQLYARVDGIVGQSLTDVGNLVSPTDSLPIVEIIAVPHEVSFSLAQGDFIALQRSELTPHPVTYRAANGGEEFVGVVILRDNEFSAETGTIAMRARLETVGGNLIANEFGEVRVLVDVIKAATVVPEAALLRGVTGYFIFVLVSPDRVALRHVIPGYRFDGKVVIENGIEEGEEVVINGQLNLRDDSRVYIAPPKGKEEKS